MERKVECGNLVKYAHPTPFGVVVRPALVVNIWPNECVNLQVFFDGDGSNLNDQLPNVVWKLSINHDPNKAPHTWHW